jgi:hypothetical protein
MHRSKSSALGAALLLASAVGLLAACGDSGKQNRAAYDACLASSAAAALKAAGAKFAAFEEAKVTGSTGEEELRVNIPYEAGPIKTVFQCIAQKQRDGSFKVVF